jgi:hypothetical protein
MECKKVILFKTNPGEGCASDGTASPCRIYGDNFSRCGKWSRFQRAKAASLVSSNRNGSVGDSTWPALKTTLALPYHIKRLSWRRTFPD